MAYTFDGVNKLIILSNGTTTVDAKDMYSRWKDWSLVGDNAKYLQALSVLGGDPLPGGRYLGTTYFLENGWKIRPFEGNHTLVLQGNLYSRDGSDPFVSTLGNYNVRIMLTVSNLVDTVSTGGNVYTLNQIASAVRSELTPELTHVMTLQNGMGLDSTQATMLLELYRIMGLDPSKPLIVTQSSRTAGAEIQQTISTNATQTNVVRN
jgi:hypothetical protein